MLFRSLREADRTALQSLYQTLEFRGLLRELNGSGPEPSTAQESREEAAPPPPTDDDPALASVLSAPRQYETILDDATLELWLARLAEAPVFSFDTETTSLDYITAEIVGVSFATAPGIAAYLPLGHRYPGAPDQLPASATLARLKPLLEDARRPKICQHGKFDTHVLANAGITLAGARYDTMRSEEHTSELQSH